MIDYKLDAKKTLRAFAGIEKRAGDTAGILRRWLGYMRHKAKERFADVGPPLAASTQRKYEQTRKSSVTVAGNLRRSYVKNLGKTIERRHFDKDSRQVTERGKELIAELRRLAGGGDPSQSGLSAEDKTIEALRKKLQRAQTKRRVGGDRRKIERHKILGRLRTSLEGKLLSLSAKLRNRVPWSRAHNEGATVGHGASLPARTTLQILAEDVTELAKIEIEHLLGIRGRR